MAFSLSAEPVEIFFSLSEAPEDAGLYKKLRIHLTSLQRKGPVELWHKGEAAPGSSVSQVSESHFRRAQLIILLMSADFIASNRCYAEMQRAQQRSEAGNARIVCVLLRPINRKSLPLDQYEILPMSQKPISSLRDREAALAEVAERIHTIIEEMAWQPTSEPTHSLDSFPSLPTLPYQRNPFFTDRQTTLDALHEYFNTGANRRTLALNGLRGIGKTQLAREYAHRYQQEYQAQLWLRTTPRTQLSIDSTSLANSLGFSSSEYTNEQQLFAAIRNWLQQHDRWLLVLDDVEDFTLISQFVPIQEKERGHVLVIAQDQATGNIPHTVPVERLPTEEAALLLLRRAKIIGVQDSHEATTPEIYSDARAIADELGGYPLALDQAGAYIEETRRDLKSFLRLYRQQRIKLLARRGRQMHDDDSQSVTTTFALAFEKIEQSNPQARDLLRLLAFLHPETIPQRIFEEGAPALEEPLRILVSDPFVFDEAIELLLRFSLIKRQAETTSLSLHPIVQTVLRETLSEEQQRHWATQALKLVSLVFPEARFKTRARCELYLPQALKCLALSDDFQLALKEAAPLFQRLGAYCYQHARYSDAENALKHALRLYEEHFQDDALGNAQTLNTLARVSYQRARYAEAETLYLRALTLRAQVLGQDHPSTAESLHNLGVFYGDQGQYQQAEQYYLRALAIKERTLRSGHIRIAKTLNSLGLNYYRQDNYSQAEDAYKRARDIYEQSTSPDHPDLAYPLTNLGALYEKLERYPEAETLYLRALAIREGAFGEQHPATARSLNNLGSIAEAQGQYSQAEDLYRRALNSAEQALGPAHPDVARFLNNLAHLLASKSGQYEQAEPLYQRALNIYQQGRDAEDLAGAAVLNNLGQLYRHVGQREQAEQFLRHALTIRTQRLAATHPTLAESLHNLAELLIERQEYTAAAPLLQQALTIRLEKLGSRHPDTISTREAYRQLLKRLNLDTEGDEAAEEPDA